MAEILDGKELAKKVRKELKLEVQNLKANRNLSETGGYYGW